VKELILISLKKMGILTPLSWVASYFIDKLIVFLEKNVRRAFNMFIDSIKNKNLKKIDEKNEQKYQETLANPDKTEQQLDDSTSDFLNGSK